MTIPTLDQTVLEALDFFIQTPPVKFDVSQFSLPIVVGSGNAINTGKILFSGQAAIFADESTFATLVKSYEPVIQKGLIQDVIVISASGEKDSIWEVELAKKMNLKTTLLTCKGQSTAAKIAHKVYTYKSIAEPYTYNTSTYLGMILSTTGESATEIQSFIQNLALPSAFNNYEAYAFVLADKFIDIAPMIEIKRDELFGPHVMIRAVTQGHARHAKFVHPTEKELVIGIGEENIFFGDANHRWNIALPSGASFGTVIAVTYYLCGLIQKVKPDYFMQHITAFCTDYGPKAYGKKDAFEVIVPASQ
jgi:hypothetical protein